MSKKAKTHYAVRVGRTPGIYTSWAMCRTQIDGFSGAEFKGFYSRVEAEKYLEQDGLEAEVESLDRSSASDLPPPWEPEVSSQARNDGPSNVVDDYIQSLTSEGAAAYRAGEDVTDNPHILYSPEREYWAAGWNREGQKLSAEGGR